MTKVVLSESERSSVVSSSQAANQTTSQFLLNFFTARGVNLLCALERILVINVSLKLHFVLFVLFDCLFVRVFVLFFKTKTAKFKI